jgi:hypothetical protein
MIADNDDDDDAGRSSMGENLARMFGSAIGFDGMEHWFASHERKARRRDRAQGHQQAKARKAP